MARKCGISLIGILSILICRWMMTEWTPCSRTCGKGTQNRQVACTQQLRNGTLIRARERDCLAPKPTSAQRCEGQDCMTVWEAGIWSEVQYMHCLPFPPHLFVSFYCWFACHCYYIYLSVTILVNLDFCLCNRNIKAY